MFIFDLFQGFHQVFAQKIRRPVRDFDGRFNERLCQRRFQVLDRLNLDFPELVAVERRQLGGEYLPPAARDARHALVLCGKHGPRLLSGLAIGALHDGLEPAQLAARAVRRAREAVGLALERGERGSCRAIERAAGKGADLIARTAQAPRERVLLGHCVPDVEAQPQLGLDRGVGDVDPRIELDPERPGVGLPPDAQPDFIDPG